MENKIKLLDGSYGFQLNKHLEKPVDHDPLWSSRALITDSEAVIKTHMDYIQVGVDIIETNTYQASIEGFMQHLNISKEESYQLIQKAVELAKIAVERCEKMGYKRPLIAGSVGPYGAYLHDGSEYTGSYMQYVSEDTLRQFHEPRIDALIKSKVDLLAIETIPSKKEALVILDVVRKYPDVKVWVSFSCKWDGMHTNSNDNFCKAAVEVYESDPAQIVAVGVNCIAPHAVEPLIRPINQGRAKPIPLIVYANSGENYDPQTGWDNNCEKLEEYIPTWLNLGAKIIGGCCRVCANYIEKIKYEVEKWESEKNK
nr:unnamed protein product [Callosobruchus analis]